jgi:hypothetical protein
MIDDLECLGEQIAELAAHLDAATHRLLTAIREFDERGGWHTQGAISCAHWLAWRVGWDLVTARQRVRVARKLAEFAAIDDALRRGELSYSKVRALLRIATPANEALILDQARLTTAAQLETLTRKYALVQRHGQDRKPQDDEQRRYVRRRDTEDGMVKLEAVLHPEEAELVWAMLDHAAKQACRSPASHSQLMADSAESSVGAWPAVELATSTSASGTGGDGAAKTASADSAESFVSAWLVTPSVVELAASASASGTGGDDAAEATSADSAESPALTRGAACQIVACQCRSEAPEAAHGPSLFDRMIDEVEAAEASRAVARRAEQVLRTDDDNDLGHNAATGDAGPTPAPAALATPPRMLRQRADAAQRAFNRADALISVAQAYLRGDRPQRSPVDVTITIPAGSLRQDAIDTIDVGCICAACISAETARRLSCDAGVTEIVEDENGVPLSVGRKRRTIAGSLKRALLRRDTSCSYPGCTNRTFLEGHHIQHWADGGATTLDNAALLCSHHHRHVHEYGYTIELDAERRPQFRDPNGRLVATAPPRRCGPSLAGRRSTRPMPRWRSTPGRSPVNGTESRSTTAA